MSHRQVATPSCLVIFVVVIAFAVTVGFLYFAFDLEARAQLDLKNAVLLRSALHEALALANGALGPEQLTAFDDGIHRLLRHLEFPALDRLFPRLRSTLTHARASWVYAKVEIGFSGRLAPGTAHKVDESLDALIAEFFKVTNRQMETRRILVVCLLGLIVVFIGIFGALVRAAEQHRAALVQAQAVSATLFAAQDGERRLIAMELHDDVAQTLALAKMRADVAGRADIAEVVSRAIAGVRSLSARLFPATLTTLGPGPAIRDLCADFSNGRGPRVSCTIDDANVAKLKKEHAMHLYRIIQEALTNAVRHADAAAVEVAVSVSEGQGRAEIADDGRGMATDCRAMALGRGCGNGLRNIEERTRILGGRLEIDSSPTRGTRISVSFPCPDEVDA